MRIVFKRQVDGDNCKFRETFTRGKVVTPRYVRWVDRGSRIHWLARLYTIGEATNRLETAEVWIFPGPKYATWIRIPSTVDSGVAKNLLARRHFNEILEQNPELQMHTTYTRFVATRTYAKRPRSALPILTIHSPPACMTGQTTPLPPNPSPAQYPQRPTQPG